MIFLLFLLLELVASQVVLESHSYNSAQGTSSFFYTVSSSSIVSWTLGLDNCVEIQPISAVPSTSLSISLDPATQISGIKWQTSSTQYRVDVRGHVRVGSTSFGIDMGAYKTVTGVVDGPVCGYYEDVVCDAGGPYYAVCHNNELSVHLLGHQSLHATSYEWKHFIPGANILTPASVTTVIQLPLDACQENYRVTLTVTGKDPSDKRTCIAYIFVNDQLAPVFENVYEGDISVEPHDIPAPMVLTAHDDCDPSVKIHYNEERVETGLPCSYELHRVWTAVDSCQNSATHTQVIIVMDTEAPVLSGVEGDNTYPCDAVPPPCVVEGNDYNPVTVDMTEFKNEGQCDCEYSVVRKWVATDCAGNKATASQKVTVEDKEPPTIYGVPESTTAPCDAVPTIPSPSAVDNCCDATITYFDSKSTGNCIHDYTLTRTWTATDSCGYKSTKSQDIIVSDNAEPTLSHVADDITVDCNEIPLPCEVEATDNCDDYVTVQFSEGTSSSDDCTEIITYTWTATDKCGNSASETQEITVTDNEDPVLSGLPPHSLVVDCDAIPQFFVKVTDNCKQDITVQTIGPNKVEDIYMFTYTEEYIWKAVDDCGNEATWTTSLTVQDNEDPILIGVPDDYHVSCDTLPDVAKVEGLDNCCSYALDPQVSEHTEEGSCDDAFTKIFTWTLEDCNHNRVVASQTIYVEDIEAPTITGLPGYEVIKCEDEPRDVEVHVNDNCDKEVTYHFEKKEAAGSCKTQYKILRTWSATDTCGNAFSYTQTIVTYDDHAPVLKNVPKDTTVQCEYDYTGAAVSAEDNCDEYISVIPTETKKDGTCDYDKVWYRHWYAADDCGNSVTATQTITIIDDEPPFWTTTITELLTEEYPNEPEMPVVTAADNCEYSPEVTDNERKLQFGYVCQKAYRLVRAWFVIDVCGNMGPPLYQHVVIDDNRAPQFIEEVDDITVECDEIPPPPPMFATDHYEEITVSMKEETEYGNCNNDYEIIRTWYAEDSCNNLNTTQQIVYVYDNTPPVFYNNPVDMTVECEPPAPATVTAEDNCDGYLDVSFDYDEEVTEVDYTSDSSLPFKTVYREWSVKDTCGNLATVKQTIRVYDTKVPTFQKYSSNVVYECDEVPTTPPTVRYNDECDSNPSAALETSKDQSDAGCLDPDTIIYTWTVTDFVNHQSTFSQTISIVDTTPPVLAVYAQDTIEVECNSIPDQGDMTATDNCDYDVVPVATMQIIPVDPNCQNRQLRLWTWTATDKCGNDASYTKTVKIDDTTPPELECEGEPCGDYEVPDVECDNEFINQYVSVTAKDECDNDVVPVETHITEHGTCEDTYLKISTYVATDDCGNSATWIRTLSVSDTTPPEWDTLPDSTKSVPYHGDLRCPSDLSASDNCDDNVNVQCNAEIENGKCEQEYTKTCTCHAEDNCGNKINFVQVISVFDDEAPTIVQPSNSTVECLSSLVTPPEPEVKWGYGGGSLTMTQRTIPDDCKYTVIYTWLAVDECHLQDSVDQTITVEDSNGPVISGVPAGETVDCHPGAPVEYLTGHDECDGKVLVMFDSEKVDDEGPYCYTLIRKWSAVDHCGQITVEYQTVVVEDNEAPVVTYPPQHLQTDCHSLPLASEEDVQVTDNCDPQRNVSFTDERIDGSCDCEWTQYRQWVACDSCGNCVTVHQTVDVIDDTPPSLSLYPGDLTVQTGDVPYPPEVIGLDNYGATTEVIYNETRFNSSYTADSTFVYILYRSWVTADGCGNTDYKEQTITVIDTIPVVITGVPKDVVLECPTNDTIPVEYSTATITAAIEAGLPTDEDVTLTLIHNMWLEGSCENEWNWIRCWQTEDHSQNTHVACFTITSVDNVPPYWLNYPEVEFAECNPPPIPSDGDPTVPNAEDNCVCGATVTGEQFDNRGDGVYSGHVVNVWTATDCCGATAIHTQTIWVSDSTRPTWDDEPSDLTICCDEPIPTIEMTAQDVCHPDVTVVGIDWKEVICEGEYILYYTWRATDSSGNWISYDLQIYVEDCYEPNLFAGLAASYDANNQVPIASSPDHESFTTECPWVETYKPIYATDPCLDYEVDVSLYDITRWGGYCDRNVLFYWNVVDDCGHEASWSQTVNIVDTTPPVISGCPTAEVVKHCGEPLDKPYVSGSDVCDPIIEVVRTEEITTGTCDNEYTSVITWTVEDHCGLTDSCSQTTKFEDRESPVLILHGPEEITVDCATPYTAPSVSASDDCQDYFTIDYDQTQTDGDCPCEYTLTRTWTTSDKCEQTDTITQIVHVEDNEPPTIHGVVKDVTVDCLHLPPKPSLTVSDNCCEASLDYTPVTEDGSCDSEYEVIRTWVANDECGHSTTKYYTVTVVDNDDPVFNPHFLQHFIKIECEDLLPQGQLTATDECGDVVVTPNEYKHGGPCEYEYALVRVWTAVDICGNSASFVQTISVVDSTPPTFEVPDAESYECGFIPTPSDGPFTAVDKCDKNPTVVFSSQMMGADCSDNWSVLLLWVTRDVCGNEAMYSLVIPVDDTIYPELHGVPAHTTVQCDLPNVAHVTATDNCDHLLTPTFEQQLPYAECPYVYTAVRSWTVTDRCLNTVTETQTITVLDDGDPTLSDPPPPTDMGCKDTLIPEKLIATDHCQKALSVDVDMVTVPGSCPYQYVIIVTWTANDECGGTASQTQTVTVNDDVPPTMSTTPNSLTVECDDIPPVPHVYANDDCSYAVEVKFSETTQNVVCDNEYDLVRLWVAKDECGNMVSGEQTIEVSDNTPPVIPYTTDKFISVPCDDIPAMQTYTPSDNCDGFIQYKEDEQREDQEPCDNHLLIRTYTVTDACGNTYVDQYTVQVTDEEEPVIIYAPPDISMECDEYTEAPEPAVAQDNCHEVNVDWTKINVPNEDCDKLGMDIYTWVAADECGLDDTHVQTITHVDNTPPVITGHDDVTCEIGNIPPPWKCEYIDNCDGAGTVDYVPQKETGSCDHEYKITYTCEVTDCAGNPASASHVVHVYDYIPPVLIGVPADITVEYQKVPLLSNAHRGVSVTDNSDSYTGQVYTATLVTPIPEVKIPGYDANDYTLIRTFTAEDDCGNRVQEHQTITVIDNTPPCFDEYPANVTVECDSIPEPCEIFTVGENLIVSFYESKEQQADYSFVIKRKWVAADHTGNAQTHEQFVTVRDRTAPVFTRKPDENVYIPCDCEDLGPMAVIGAIDNCDEFVTVDRTSDITKDPLCEDKYTIVRKWSVSDHAGNEAHHTQYVHVSDTEKPTYSETPGDVTYHCDEEAFSMPPKIIYIDNCDPDPEVFGSTSSPVSTQNPCHVTRWYSTSVRDRCGNHAQTITWSITFKDETPPVVQGSKHCVHKRKLDNAYGSAHLYKRYDLSTLYTASDSCSNGVDVVGVYFNRSTDDTTNLFESAILKDKDGSYADGGATRTVFNLLTKWGADYYMRVAIEDPLSFSAGPDVRSCRLTVYAFHNQHAPSSDGHAEEILFDHSYTPALRSASDFQDYDLHFIAKGYTTTVEFQCDPGLMWQLEAGVERSPTCHTSHGEGVWAPAPIEDVPLRCSVGPVLATGPAFKCNTIKYNGLIWRAVNNRRPVNDRFCFLHPTRPWLSITSYAFNDGSVYWVITNFAAENPNAYVWNNFEGDLANQRRTNPNANPRELLESLRARGTIDQFWRETVEFSPVDGPETDPMNLQGISCHVTPGQLPSSCQAACYQKGFNTAWIYDEGSQFSNECHCGTNCQEDSTMSWMKGNVGTYKLWHWQEGFYVTESGDVYILAYTDTNDLKINMWIIVEDSCWNTATTLVEFWIAPSVESAASIGRQCDEPDYTPVAIGEGSFTSAQVISGAAMVDSNLDRLFIKDVSWEALLSHGLVLGAVGNAQSLFQGGFNLDDQKYLGTIMLRVRLTTWSVDLARLVERCLQDAISTTVVIQADFPWSECAPLRSRANDQKLGALLNFVGTSTQTNKATKIILDCNGGPGECVGQRSYDIRNYYDDVRMDGNGNLQAVNPENQFVTLQSVTIQNAGLTPVGVRSVEVEFWGNGGNTKAEYDYGMDPPPSWTLQNGNLKEATLINECDTAGIDWCSFDFYSTTLSDDQKLEWIERQRGQFLQDGSFRNSLSLEGLVGFRILAPLQEQPEQTIADVIDIAQGNRQMAEANGAGQVQINFQFRGSANPQSKR